MRKPAIVGLAGIDKAIKSIAGIADNLNERIQDVAVAIIDHANGAGNGDMSRSLTLCKTVARYRTLNVAYLIGFFRHFGNATINLKANDGIGKVSLLTKDSKAYRGGFDVDGAKANNWSEAFDNNGNRAPWYQGAAPVDFQPMTIGDVAADFERFVDRETKRLNGTTTVKGKDVPTFNLSDADRAQVTQAFQFIGRIAATLARHEETATLQAKLAELTGDEAKDEQVEAVLEPQEKMVA